jgi:hypothetical protein
MIETVQYIQHRLTIAGGNKDIFSHLASATIFYYSGGIPRIINSLCDLSLAYGYSIEALQLGPEHILEVVKSKYKTGLFPSISEPNKDAQEARQLIKEKTKIDIGILEPTTDSGNTT